MSVIYILVILLQWINKSRDSVSHINVRGRPGMVAGFDMASVGGVCEWPAPDPISNDCMKQGTIPRHSAFARYKDLASSELPYAPNA